MYVFYVPTLIKVIYTIYSYYNTSKYINQVLHLLLFYYILVQSESCVGKIITRKYFRKHKYYY